MARNVQIIDRGYNEIMRRLKQADDSYVDVGIFEGERNSEGAIIAEYATANEYGTSKIPSRPAHAIAFDESKTKINADMQLGLKRVIDGSTAARELNIIGLKHQQRIQNVIRMRDILPKLKQGTVRQKRGSTKTLIDTSAMVNAVTYAVHIR